MSMFTLAISCFTPSNLPWFMDLTIGEGNGNPLQYSCLENPRDRGSWWAAVYGVTQTQTQLKRLSSRRSMDLTFQVPVQYLFTASDLASITSHIQSWVLFLLWLHLFVLSGVICPFISSSILGTYWPGEFIFQCPSFLPFHTVHGVLKARILKWFAVPFSSDHILSELSTKTHPSWVALHSMA